jgi:hypothetical protein
MSAPKDMAGLRARALAARASGLPPALRDTARRTLVAWIDTAAAHGMPLREALRRLRDGEAAQQAGLAVIAGQMADSEGPAASAACAEGCAFCCILTGEDGGTMTGTEARAMQAALAPVSGQPDGRAWHPAACPALDPDSRTCRAYEARPMICRSYLSPDAALCQRIAEGEAVSGPGVLGAYPVYLAVLALTREMLRGTVAVPTYSLRRIAAGSVAGEDAETALDAARHAPRELTRELDRQAAAIRR